MLILNLLASNLKMYHLTMSPNRRLGKFDIDGVSYELDEESSKVDGFIGFYDWLRVSETEIIGVRMCFFEHHGYNDLFARFTYLHKTYSNCIEAKFVKKSYNDEISGDQDFTGNFVYKSSEDEYLITFNLDYLTTRELEGLIAHCIPLQL